jgi:hypothetical protein
VHCTTQLLPPFVVLRMVPEPPTAQPVCASIKCTPRHHQAAPLRVTLQKTSPLRAA